MLHRAAKHGLGSAYRAGFARVLGRGGLRRRHLDGRRLLARPRAVEPSSSALVADGADVVIGSRYVPGGGTTDWPVRRQLLSKWGNTYTRAILGVDAHDCT